MRASWAIVRLAMCTLARVWLELGHKSHNQNSHKPKFSYKKWTNDITCFCIQIKFLILHAPKIRTCRDFVIWGNVWSMEKD